MCAQHIISHEALYLTHARTHARTHTHTTPHHTTPQTAMFPPSTPPMIITMCSSSILNEMRRLRDNVTFTPEELDTLIVWKEGATPQPNPNPARPPPPPASSRLAEGQPLPFVPSSSEDIAASGEATATGEEGEEKWPEGMPKVRENGICCVWRSFRS